MSSLTRYEPRLRSRKDRCNMPLIKSAKKSAFKKNVETEMEAHPNKRKQDLAIAFSVQRQAKKKKMAEGGKLDMKAEGGTVGVKAQKRPMPENEYNDAKDISQ